jgi:hypothetical protein
VKANYVLVKVKSRERADCTVLATQFAFGLSYENAHSLMAAHGRKLGCCAAFQVAAPKLGLVQRPDLSCQTVIKALEGMQNGRFVVKISGHVFAVADGRIFDNHFTKPGARVKMVYEVPLNNPEVMARYPYLEKCVALAKLPDIRGINQRRLAGEVA